MISPGQVRIQDLLRVKRMTSHYATVARASAAKNTGVCIRVAYLKRSLVSLRTIPATKKPLVKNFEPHMFFSAVLINTDKETENKFLLGLWKCFKNMSTSVSSSAQRFIMMKRHIFLDAGSRAEYISLQVNKLHFIRCPWMLRMDLTGKNPDQLEILIGNKTHIFFLIRGVATRNLSTFSPKQVTCPKKNRNYFPREVTVTCTTGGEPETSCVWIDKLFMKPRRRAQIIRNRWPRSLTSRSIGVGVNILSSTR